ncbi:MAG: hypothetical protein JXR71_09055 [Bacteroidales bacterium]|nr:hypothetical protein [Bacteroidales bacterium]
MEHKITRILSVILHPLLVPSYFLLLLYQIPQLTYSLYSDRYRMILSGFVLLLTFVLPVLILLLMKLMRIVASLMLEGKNERFLPMLLVAVIYFLAFYTLYQTQLPGFRIFSVFMLGSSLLILAALFINFFTQISLHLLAWGGFTGGITGIAFLFSLNLFFWLFLILFLSAITAYSRLENKAHTPFQIYLGYLSGFFFMTLLFLLSGLLVLIP